MGEEASMARGRGSRVGVAAALVVGVVGLWSTLACAEEKAPVKRNGVYVFDDLIVSARRQRPQAGIDVARLVPRAPLPELRQPLVERIAKAVEKDPF
jgi:hypothetical protein